MAHRYTNLGIPIEEELCTISPIAVDEAVLAAVHSTKVRSRIDVSDMFHNSGTSRQSASTGVRGVRRGVPQFGAVVGDARTLYNSRETSKSAPVGSSGNLKPSDIGEGGKFSQRPMKGDTRGYQLESLRGVEDEAEELLMRGWKFCGLMTKFNDPKVWKDYVEGRIYGKPPDSLVHAVVRLKQLFLLEEDADDCLHRAKAIFLSRMCLGSCITPLSPEGKSLYGSFTYIEWSNYLHDILASSYWDSLYRSVRIEQRGGDYYNEYEPDNQMKEPFYETDNKRGPRKVNERRSLEREDFGCVPKKKIRKNSSSSSSSGSDSSVSTPKRRYHRKDSMEDILRLMKNMGKSREVVKPEAYNSTGSESLREFLAEYECYFDEKYEGNDKQRAKILGEFLVGDIKDYYQAIGGSKLKYSDVKEKLKEWNRQ